MKILVCISHVPDTTTRISFTDNDTKLNTAGVQFIIGPFDDYALARAVELKEAGAATHITAVNVGLSDTEPTLRKALAIGADEAVRINAFPTDAWFVASQIAQYTKDKDFDLILTGRESIDFNGNTGPFIQYTHARIKSVLRKADEQGISHKSLTDKNIPLSEKENYLVQTLTEFPQIVKEAGDEFSPALIANYIYELVKEYNQFYHDFSILREENADLKVFRLVLSETIANVIKTGMGLLGIEVPERM